VLYHLIARGIERRDIYTDVEDRHAFVDRLSSLLEKTCTFAPCITRTDKEDGTAGYASDDMYCIGCGI
jgi:hypothetical protein